MVVWDNVDEIEIDGKTVQNIKTSSGGGGYLYDRGEIKNLTREVITESGQRMLRVEGQFFWKGKGKGGVTVILYYTSTSQAIDTSNTEDNGGFTFLLSSWDSQIQKYFVRAYFNNHYVSV